MNRADRHFFLVMAEKINKKSKRQLQSYLARKRHSSKAGNDLINVLNRAIAADINTPIGTIVDALHSNKEETK